jgi:hypothetical protein
MITSYKGSVLVGGVKKGGGGGGRVLIDPNSRQGRRQGEGRGCGHAHTTRSLQGLLPMRHRSRSCSVVSHAHHRPAFIHYAGQSIRNT